ncbi:hypothetical protein [Planomonospora venezuelensis]|uniref:Uncharacterized protein n=1 Tax=Planomonospora venezuelensis TaxID=1999 RepID=A0A841D8Y7_PLAVE|nr:hypothetical protein [Planomonospora venezuelensis]MBB5965057.1 hypothetical protein [Planomonospora venezuelensis]GIN05026.1 hypothetical protein Pve01_66840 [Planomonospora venezuelensis]
MAHATSEQYETYTDTTAPSNIGLLLARASRLVDQALLCAVYDVDDDGVATEAAVLTALEEATIEQVHAWVAVGEDGTNATAEYGDVAIGSVRLGRRSSSGGAGGGSAATRLAPQAAMVLAQAGLTGQSPYSYQVCETTDE